jgi:hypothetical protein
LCADIEADQTGRQPIAPGEPVGYSFDPLPSTIRRDLLLKIKPIDHLVLAILISFAVWRRDSCWTTVKIVAARIRAIRPGRSHKPTACERTVQRSIERLKAAGLIDHRRVAKPDPDQPDNTTGWRFYFLWPMDERPGPRREVTKGPGEVTKGPGEVTKGSPDVPTPASSREGEVTKESGDSIVTQFRGDVREPESTLNVAALAGEGDGEPAAIVGPMATGETSRAVVWTHRELAEKLVRSIRASGVDLRVELDPERGEVIQPVRLSASARELPSGVIDRLKRLRPHVLAYLKGQSSPPGPEVADDQAGGRGPAPRVPRAARAGVLARLGRLPGNPDASDVEATAAELARVLGPHRDEARTAETFLGIARDVRRGALAADCAIRAFEEACGRGKEARGAAFVTAVKRWKRSRASGPGGRPPA